MSHFKQKVIATKAQNVLASHKDLSRFVEGQLITAQQLQEIPQAINTLESLCGLPKTTFQAFQLGQAISPGDLNQFNKPLTRLCQRLGVATSLKNFPLKPGDLIAAKTLNEIIDTINALKHRLKPGGSRLPELN